MYFEEKLSNNYGSVPNIIFECRYDRKSQISTWKRKNLYDKKLYSTLPECAVCCSDDPPPESPPTVTKVWESVVHWESNAGPKLPTYKCGEGKLLYLQLYKLLCLIIII